MAFSPRILYDEFLIKCDLLHHEISVPAVIVIKVSFCLKTPRKDIEVSTFTLLIAVEMFMIFVLLM